MNQYIIYVCYIYSLYYISNINKWRKKNVIFSQMKNNVPYKSGV